MINLEQKKSSIIVTQKTPKKNANNTLASQLSKSENEILQKRIKEFTS